MHTPYLCIGNKFGFSHKNLANVNSGLVFTRCQAQCPGSVSLILSFPYSGNFNPVALSDALLP